MTKRLTALGFAIAGVVWGPYVYAELARKPLQGSPEEKAEPVIEATPVAYQSAAQERAQLLAALAEKRKADEANHEAEVEAAEAPADPAAAEAQDPKEHPAAAAVAPSTETTPAAATDPALAAAQATAQPAQPPQAASAPTPQLPAAPEPAAAKPEEQPAQPAQAAKEAAKEPAAEPKPEEHAAERQGERKDDDKREDKKEAAEASPDSTASAFRSTFDRESRDAAWASNEEPRLTQLLTGVGVPASSISEVRCQSTVCRVALTSVDLKAVQQSPLYQLLAARVRDEFGTLGVDPSGADGEQHAAFYVLRKGAELSRETN